MYNSLLQSRGCRISHNFKNSIPIHPQHKFIHLMCNERRFFRSFRYIKRRFDDGREKKREEEQSVTVSMQWIQFVAAKRHWIIQGENIWKKAKRNWKSFKEVKKFLLIWAFEWGKSIFIKRWIKCCKFSSAFIMSICCLKIIKN